MAITVEELLTKLRFRSKIPTGQVGDPIILSTADDVIASKVLPVLMSQNQSYLKYTDIFAANNINYTYRFPKGAVGGGAVEILRVEGEDNFYNMPIYTDADKGRVRSTTRVPGFILTAGGFEVWPKPSGSFNVEITYLLRPGKLIATSSTALVSAVTTNTIELSAIPTSLSSASTWDIMRPDGLGERVAVGIVKGSPSGSVYTVTGDLSDVQAGDRIAPSGYAPFIQIPDEYIDFILDHITAKLAQHTGDALLLKTALESAKDSLPKISNTTSPRISEEIQGITIDW